MRKLPGLKRIVSRAITELIALSADGTPPQGLRILLYHAIGSTLDFSHAGISLDPGLFRDQMNMIKGDARFKPVALDLSALAAGPHALAVTFDDGYRDNLRAAAPVLADLKIPFTVFVVPSYVLGGKPYHLTLAELRELAKVPGCQIGSHGMNHRPLAGLRPRQAYTELRDSRLWLEDALARPILAASYPYGSASRAVRQAAADAGYALGATSRTGVNTPGRDPLLLCRTEVLASDDLRQFRHKLYGAWDWHRFRHKDPASR